MNRRQFLGSSAKNAAGVAAGVVALSATAVNAQGSAFDKLRIGVIGVRNRGKELALRCAALPNVTVATLCDVDDTVLAPVVRGLESTGAPAPQLERDYRRVFDQSDLDAVIIATPDHWHAALTQHACEAGKHVYVESPVTHSREEAAQLQDVVTRTGRIVQCGLQQRSGEHFRTAVEAVHQGRIGQVFSAKAWISHQRKALPNREATAAPAGVDYGTWLGTAPAREFHPHRFHYHWRWYWDYGGGELAHWGVHLLDVARWGLQVEHPVEVSAAGGKLAFADDQETPDALCVNYRFPRHLLTWEQRLWSQQGQEGRSAAVAFYGEQGTLIVDRGGWKIYGTSEASAPASECLESHLHNFCAAVRTGTPLNANLRESLLSSDLCHLGNEAYRRGQMLHVDPATGFCTELDASPRPSASVV